MKKLRYLLATSFLLLVMTDGYAINFGKLNLNKITDTVSKIAKAAVGLSEEQEIKLGRDLAAGLLGAMPLVADEEIQRYVNRVGQWLAMQTERSELAWHFAVTDTETVGAFAAPGGYIMITKGLMLLMRSEHELAGVLAHEITHVVRKHHVEAIMKEARTDLAVDFAAEAIDKNQEIAEKLLSSGMQLYARGLDREDELEADVDGVVIAARAGYDVLGLTALLMTIDAINPEDENISLLSSTHPPTRDRIDRLADVIEEEFDLNESDLSDSERFLTMQQRLIEGPEGTPVSMR